MPTTADFLVATQGFALATLGCLVLTLLGFGFRWGIRFRLVGITSFMGVLTSGLFALSLTPFTRMAVPGAARYTVVYDGGANQAVIAVAPDVTASGLEAALRQAANDLFSSGRLSRGQPTLTIRARTILHPEPGLSQPLYLGEVQRSLLRRDDPAMVIDVDADQLAQLPNQGLEGDQTR